MAAAPSDPPTDRWEGERVARWIRQSAGLERQLEPVSDVLFAAARLRAGERVLDVGCGTGPTTRRAAAEVGPDGAVTGLDVAGPMLAHAAEVPAPDGSAPLSWVEADAVTWDPPEGAYDVVLSRFGVMFFDDPDAAFATLARAAAPGGRLVVAVWAERPESELFEMPLQVAVEALRARGLDPQVPPVDGGPFSLGDEGRARDLLTGAGWTDVGREVHRLAMPFGGALSAPEAAGSALDFGPTRLVTEGADDAGRAAVVGALTEAFSARLDAEDHVTLEGTVVVLSARRP
ncbi:methyltransferase domain-containing protein [Iamia majanohamensis]|uniref:Methyltransferase domain-containing protein n=1 Tax=Iamia majanohamensis TaxID=467976 RepID=A0AAE9YJ09_9ACTN|nr:class I SAM-dependent methyltransferase [Iamia majanohamensis]WCO68951.1 methyltransferase domain-containing protein [Iamia majanohamensis]